MRAFADRMLLKVTAMDDPEDMPGVEKAIHVAAVIERIYSRCDRAERQRPETRKVEAERAAHEEAAIKARVSLAGTLRWGEERRQSLGQWWDEAQTLAQTPAQEAVPAQSPPQKPAAQERPAVAGLTEVPSWQKVTYVDYTEAFETARAELALKRRAAKSTPVPPPRPPLNSG